MKKRRQSTREDGVVYFLQAEYTRLIKVGTCHKDRLGQRVDELRRMSPVALEFLASVQGGQPLEAEFHRRFQDARQHGEWFRPVPDLLIFIAGIGYQDAKEIDCTNDLSGIAEAASILSKTTVCDLRNWEIDERSRLIREQRAYMAVKDIIDIVRADKAVDALWKRFDEGDTVWVSENIEVAPVLQRIISRQADEWNAPESVESMLVQPQKALKEGVPAA